MRSTFQTLELIINCAVLNNNLHFWYFFYNNCKRGIIFLYVAFATLQLQIFDCVLHYNQLKTKWLPIICKYYSLFQRSISHAYLTAGFIWTLDLNSNVYLTFSFSTTHIFASILSSKRILIYREERKKKKVRESFVSCNCKCPMVIIFLPM